MISKNILFFVVSFFTIVGSFDFCSWCAVTSFSRNKIDQIWSAREIAQGPRPQAKPYTIV